MTHNTSGFSKWTHPVEIPPLEEAYEALEFSSSADGQYQYVKCQKCCQAIRILGRLSRPINDKMSVLQKRISYMEKYTRGSSKIAAEEIKHAKEELQQLEAEDPKWDKLTHLPLYSSKCTGYRFYCSPCWEQAYSIYEQERRKIKA